MKSSERIPNAFAQATLLKLKTSRDKCVWDTQNSVTKEQILRNVEWLLGMDATSLEMKDLTGCEAVSYQFVINDGKTCYLSICLKQNCTFVGTPLNQYALTTTQ